MVILEDEETFIEGNVRFLKALADANRLRLLWLLSAYGEERLCVGELSLRLGISQPAVSQHLAVLKAAGLTVARRDGPRVHYQLAAERVAEDRERLDRLFAYAGVRCDEPCEKAKGTSPKGGAAKRSKA